MPVQLTVGSQTYNYPVQGDSPSWGADASDWAVAVTSALTNVQGTGDILQTSATIANNQSSAANVAGLFFNPGTVRAAIIEYSIYRVTTSTGATELAEAGMMYVIYKNGASSTTKWSMAQSYADGAGVTFSMLDSGQIQYTSTNITGSSYSGTMKFRARALLQ